MEFVGWIGSALLALCAFPQALKSIKDKHSDGLSNWFVAMWFFGEVFVLLYIFPERQYPLIANYGANVLLCIVIVWYKFFPTR